MMRRKFEYFKTENFKERNCTGNIPKKLFKQERDWTCSIACIRTILSTFEKEVPSEEYYIQNYNLTPGPYFSKDIKRLKMLDKYNVIYGCDNPIDLENLLDYIDDGYYVMVESMINVSHWLVLIGYFQLKDKTNLEDHKILLFDPYYDNVRLVNADEFYGMWIDGHYEKTNVTRDFIALKK